MTTSTPSFATDVDVIAAQRSIVRRHPSPGIPERCLGCGFAAILRLLSSTWRVDHDGLETLDALTESKHRHILAFWHGHYITLFRLLHHRPTIVVTNQSSRGQVIANICRRTGMRTLQVAGRGSKRMLLSLDHGADDGLGLAIAVDGPLGPAREVKRVVLHLAARLECPIVPISVAAGRKHVFGDRWDRLEIPCFFSSVSFVVGAPISVSQVSSRSELSQLAFRLQDTIERGEAAARQRLCLA